MESFGSKAAAALGAVGKAASVMLGAASTAAVAFGADAVSVGQTFDASMSQVAATMGYSVEQLNTEGSEAANTFKQLRDFAQDMGAKTAFSASQAADALNYMALAGYDAKTSMTMLPNVLNLAAAGGMELAAASDMITDSQSALGLSLDETAALVDKMAKASSKSNTSVSQLGSAILTVGGTAKAMKGGTTELAQVLGIIADNGVKGAEGGTALRNIILSLTAPTDKAAKTLKSLGVSALDSSGNMRSMKDIFADLNKGLGDMTEGQKTAVLSEIFNKVDLKSVNALMATNVSRWDELAGAIDDASGAAEAMANTQLDNLAGDITIFQSALEGVKIAVSDEITPALREFVQLGTQGLSDLGAAIKENGLAGAMDALGPFIDNAIGMLMEGLPKAVEFGGQLLGAVASGVINNLPKLAEGAGQVVTELGGQLIAAAPEIVSKGAELLNFLADGILNNIDSMVDVALNLIDSFAGFLGDAIPAIASKATDIIIALAEALTDPATLSNLTQSAIAIIGGIATAIIENLPRLAETAWKVITNFATYLDENFPVIFESGVDFLIKFINGVMSKLPDFIARLPEIIRGFLGFITDNLPLILSKGIELLDALITGIIDAIPALIAALPDVIIALTDFFTDNFPTIVKKGGELLGRLIVGIIGAIPEIALQLPKVISAIVGALSAGFGEMMNIGKYLLEGLWNGISNKLGWLKSKVTGIIDLIKGWFTGEQGFDEHSPSKWAERVGAYVSTGLANGIEEKASEAKQAAEKMASGIYSGLSKWADRVTKYEELSLSEQLEMWREIQNQFDEGSDQWWSAHDKIFDIEGKIASENAKSIKDTYNDLVKSVEYAVKRYGWSTQTQLSHYEEIRDRFVKGSEEWLSADEKVFDTREKLLKEQAQAVKDTYNGLVKDVEYAAKRYGISTAEQLARYEEIRDQFERGSEEWLAADEKAFDTRQALMKEQESAWKDYAANLKGVVDTVSELESDYQKELSKRAGEIANSYKLFAEVPAAEKISGKDLLKNLREQVKSIGAFYDNLDKLSERGVGAALVDEIRSMGVGASSQLSALLKLSDRKLSEYAALYGEKQELANSIATQELSGLRKETDAKIRETLDGVESLYDEYAPIIGMSLPQGLAEGIRNGMAEAVNAAEELANAALAKFNFFNGDSALTADPFNLSGGYQLSGGYSYAAPQLAAAGAGYGAAPQLETVIVEQPIQIVVNERVFGESMLRYLRTQQRAGR